MRFETVLFDLDGTIVDSGKMILASFRHATRTVLAREIPDTELLAAVGGSSLTEQMRALDRDRVDDLISSYREHNRPLHDSLEPCAGIEDVLARLDDEGRTLGIVTAKLRLTVDLAFAVLPLEQYFDVVVTADMTERHKPHPDPILHALRLAEARAESAAYVGDSPFDVAAARAAGVFSVAVTWGGIHPEERLRAERPDALVATAEQLLGVL